MSRNPSSNWNDYDLDNTVGKKLGYPDYHRRTFSDKYNNNEPATRREREEFCRQHNLVEVETE